jgi:alginate O-acetyltransferase complex protein AlgI
MTIFHILVFCLAALLLSPFYRKGWRTWILLVTSLLSVYWLQSSVSIRNLDFWFPSLSIFLTVVIWSVTSENPKAHLKETFKVGLVTALIILLIGLTRYFDPLCCLTPTRPPGAAPIIVALIAAAGLTFLFIRLSGSHPIPVVAAFSLLLVLVFLVLKSDPLATNASALLRSFSGQATSLASSFDLQAGKPHNLNLGEYITYVLFFPAIIAGPIDRSQRFVQDLRKSFSLNPEKIWAGGQRIVWGVFKKFVLADTLALVALNETNAAQTSSTFWVWVLVYAYALRIYLDFSGYTDIAIGIGLWMGVRLPENFDRPYTRQNLTLFWNSWHMTLAQWFRAYFFNPVTRALRTGSRKLAMPLIIFLGQMGTMLLIGLWHGVTWNFFLWGAWHGLGLFIHNRWSEAMRTRAGKMGQPQPSPSRQRANAIGGALITFHFVSLGWIWFALPNLDLSWHVFLKLFGL